MTLQIFGHQNLEEVDENPSGQSRRKNGKECEVSFSETTGAMAVWFGSNGLTNHILPYVGTFCFIYLEPPTLLYTRNTLC